MRAISRVLVLILVCIAFSGLLFGKSASSVTLTSSSNPSTYGSSVTFTATVTPSAATGTVTFKDGTTTLGTGTLSSGKTTFSTSTLATGSHSITAAYGGNSNYNSSTSPVLTQTVNKANTTTTLTSSANPSTYSSSVTFTATIAPSAGTGTMTFKDGTTTLGTGTISNGKATLSTSTLTGGSHSITAVYGGSANYNTSTSAVLTQTVNKTNTTTTLASSANPSTYGSSVTFTATVTPSTATGTVTFKDGSAALGTGTVAGGKATFASATLASGSHSITAAYGGDSNDNTSTSSTLTQTVNKANTTTTLTSSANPSAYGSSVKFTATVSPSLATGTVTFKDGTTTLGTGTVSAGTANFSTSTLATGSHSITAAYGGDSNDNTSTSATLTQKVLQSSSVALASSANPSIFDTVVTFVATVTPSAATGTVTFIDGSTTLGTSTISSGQASFNTSTLAVGSHSMTAAYGGSSSYASSTSPILTQSVLTVTTISITPQGVSLPIGVTQQFTATATYSNGSQGNITASATWSSSDVTVATISAAGTATGVAEGPATISAAVGSINGSASLIGAPSPFRFTGNLEPTRTLHTATVLQNGLVLIVGGDGIGANGSDDVGACELFNPATGIFTPTGSLNFPRYWHTATLLQNGMVLIAGGQSWNASVGNDVNQPVAELYNPTTGLFTVAGSLNTPRVWHTATLLQNGKVLIAGGFANSSSTATAELYDPAAGTFSYTGNLSTALENQSAILLNDGTVLIAGGDTMLENPIAAAEIYSPTVGTFAPTGSLNTGRERDTATLLTNGKVLIAGGESTQGFPATAEIYDPVAKVFTLTGNLNYVRAWATATLLNSGQVIVVGGLFNSQTGIVDIGPAELYNPTSGTFSPAGNLNIPRNSHTASLLNDGTVLIAGGGSEFGVVAQAEIYTTPGQAPGPPDSLQITPASANVIVGGTRHFNAIDNFGNPRQDVIWTVSNPSIASVSTDEHDTAVLTGLAAGQVTLTATAETASGQEQVTILAPGVFVTGTVIWSAPPVPGFSALQLVQAVPTASGPDLYSTQLSSDGTQTIIQALMADGEQLWQTPPMSAVNNNSVPDGSGGLLVTQYETCTPGQTNPLTVVDLDPVYGQPTWSVSAAGIQEGNQIVYCYGNGYDAPQIAVRGDGAVAISEPTNNGFPPLSVMNLPGVPAGTGVSYPIPPSTNTINGKTINVQCCMGPPMVNVDGTIYVEYEVRNVNNNIVTSDSLYLQQINADNTWPHTFLSSTSGQNQLLLPGPIVPDGQGGILATWTIASAVLVNPPVIQYPYQAVDVAAGVVGTSYNLPFSPTKVAFGQSPTIVLGQNGDGIATNGTDAVNGPVVASFSLTSGSINWSYQGTAGDTLSIIQATADGGVTINDSSTGVIQLSSTGSPEFEGAGRRKEHGSIAIAGVSSALQGAVPLDLSDWISTAGGSASVIWSPNGSNNIPTVLAQTVNPMPKGNAQGQSLPPFCQRKNVNCALAPYKDGQATSPNNYLPAREVAYRLFSLQNGTLTPFLYGNPQIQGVKIEEWEANASNGADICSWLSPNGKCESPNDSAHGGNGFDGPGQYTDDMGAGLGAASFTISQQFLVDRQGVQVFWPYSGPVWYGAWGTPSSPPPGFQPNQTANVTTGWAVITQISVNTNAPTACPSGCDTLPAQAGPPNP